MRSVTVVCDNHHDRIAVATYYVALFTLGRRPLFPMIEAGPPGRTVDLCSECAAILGWQQPPDPPEPEFISDGQRRLLFARCREIGLDDDARHDLLEEVTGRPSSKFLLAKDFDRVVEALDAEASRRHA